MRRILFLIVLLYSTITTAQIPTGITVITRVVDTKFQFVTTQTGVPVSQQLWDEADPFMNGFARVFLKDKFSFVNNEGKLINPVEFEDARDFSNNLAAVQKDGKWGFINGSGLLIIPFTYEIVFDFDDTVSVAYENRKWWLINNKGQQVKLLDISVCFGFKNGIAKVIKNDYEGVLDRNGNITLNKFKTNHKSIGYHSNLNVTAASVCPPNINFENGNFTNWLCYTGRVDSAGNTNVITMVPATPVAPVNNRHTIITRATPSLLDPYGLFPINPPDGSNRCVKLGNTSVGAQAERIRYKISVPINDTNFSIKYDYAVVFQNPGHTLWTQPRFVVKVLDSATNTYITCASFEYVSTSGLPGFQVSTVNSAVIYKPWASVFVSMRGYAGRTLYLEFTTADCVRTAHWGYAYLDVESVCGQAIEMQYDCTFPNITTLTGPPGFQTYKWWNQNYTTLIGTGQTITLNPGPTVNTIYWLEMIPFANFGCKDTLMVKITGTLIPQFNMSDTAGCTLQTLTFYNRNLPSLTTTWNFGDGNFGTGDTVTHTYLLPGTYTVQMNVTVPSGCNGTATHTVVIKETPNVLQPPNQSLCNGAATAAISFSGALGGTVFNWLNNNPSIGLAASGSGNIASFTAINTTNAPVTATIAVTPSAAGCTGVPKIFTITVNPIPNVVQPANQILCNGTTTNAINFISAVTGTSFNWTNNNTSIGLAASGSGNIAAFTAINTGNAPVTATITVTPSAVGCPGTQQTFTITVNPTPNVTQPDSQILCNGSTTSAITFTGAISGTIFNWTNNNPSIGLAANGIGNIAAFTAINVTNAPVTATITITPSASGCAGLPQIFTITVNPSPNVVQTPNQSLCNGATTNAIAFTGAVSGSSFTWTNNNTSIGLAAGGNGNIAPFTAINTTNAPVTATITVTPSATGCAGAPQIFTITVRPTPNVTQPANQTLCNGSTTNAVTFNGVVSGTSFSWTNNNTSIGLAAVGIGNIGAFTAINTTNAPVTANITVTPTAVGCGGTPRTFTIIVNPTPDVAQPANQTLCNGATTNAITFAGAVSGTNFSWTNNNISIGLAASGSGNIPAFTALNPGITPVTATITVTPFTPSCPGSAKTFTITVSPNANVVPPTNQIVCNGATTNTITFTGSVTGSTFSWTNNNTSIGLAAGGSGNIAAFTAINTNTSPVTATITVTPSAVGCTGIPQTFTITVNPTPNVVQPADQILCNGATTNSITFNGAVAGTSFNWVNNNPSIGLAASGTGGIASFTAINLTNAPVTALITVTPSASGCAGLPQTFSITVNAIPDVVEPANQTLCNGATTNAITFAGAVSGTTFSWINNNISIGLAASGTGNIPSFTALNPGSTPVTATLTVTPSTSSCPGTAKTFTITVTPNANVAPPANQIVCNGATTNTITFTGSVTGSTFSWTNNNTSIGLAAGGNGNIAAFTAFNTTTLPVTATITVTPSAVGCTGIPQTFTITVNPTPNVVQPADQILCNGATTNSITFNGAVAGTSFNWVNNNPSIGLAASGTGDIASFTAINLTNAPVTAIITVTPSASGCTGLPQTFSITVNPIPDVVEPANQTLCNGATTNAITFAGAVSGTTFNWTNNNISIGLAASGTGNIPSFTALNPGSSPVTATLTVTPSTSSCPGSAKTFTITVTPNANVAPPANQIVCNGATTNTITFTGSVTGSTFTWTNNNTSIGLAAGGNGNITAFTAINTTTSPVTATITVTPSAVGCTGIPQTFTITVNPTPNVVQPAEQILCNGATTNSITFNGAVTGTSFNWVNNNPSIGLAASGTGGIASFTAINLTNTPVTATITVTPSALGCSGTPQTFTITVNPTPDVAQPANQTLCNGATTNAITFAGAVNGTTFNWTNNNISIGLAASGSGNIPAFIAVNPGSTPVTATISVTPTFAGCAGSPETFIITINPIPNVAQPANQILCNGAATNAIIYTGAVSGTAFNWTNNNPTIGLAASGTGAIASFTAINLTNAPVTATITVTPSALGCTGLPQTFSITVNPIPDVVQPADQTLCNGATTNAINFAGGVNGTTYTWTNDNTSIGLAGSGNGNIPAFAVVNPGSTAITATITVTPSTLSCPGNAKTFTITVTPNANVVPPTNQIVCNGATTNSITFTGSVIGTTFNWTNNNTWIGLAAGGNGNIAAFTAINTTTSPVTATITVTPSAVGCTGIPQTFTITVNPTPNVVQPADQILCNGATTNAITFTGAVSGTAFNWTNSNPAIGLAASGTGNIPSFNAINLSNAPITATITVTPSAWGCPGVPQTFTITVKPTPDVLQPANQILCNGATTNAITFAGSVNSTLFNWTNTNPGIGLAAAGVGNIPSFTAVNITNVPISATITVTPSASGCMGTLQTFTVTVNPAPDVVQPGNQILCNGATTAAITFAGAVSGTAFTWTNNNSSIGLAATGNGNIGAFTALNVTNAPVTATITVTPSAAGCTGLPKTFTITVNPTPGVAQPANQTLCNGAVTNMIAFTGSVSGTAFSWTNNNPSIGLAANGNGDIPAFTAINITNAPVTATITVTPSAAGCTGLPQVFTIIVNPIPNVVQPANQTLCNGAVTNAVTFSGAVSGTAFNWTNSNPSIGLGASGTGDITSFTAINLSNVPVTATISVTPSALGCTGLPQTLSITVNPIPDVVQPADQTLCNGATTNAITFAGAVNGTTYTWTNDNTSIGLGAGGTGNIPAFAAINPGITPIIATIRVTPSTISCPGTAKTFTITVTPSANVVQPANQVLCNGATTNTITFTGSVSGTSFSWTNTNTSIGLAASGSGNIIPAFTAINITNTPVTATITVMPSAVGCTGTPQTFTVTVNPTPNVVQPANQTLCNGAATAAITFTGSVIGTSFNWTNNNASIGLASSGNGNITAFTAINTGTTPVTATISVIPAAPGCTGLPESFTITVNPTPNVVQPVNQSLCNGATTNAIAFTGAVSGTAFNWTNSNPTIGLAANGNGNIPAFTAINITNAPVTATITVTPSVLGCTGSPQTFIITVNPTPNVLQPANQILCNGATTNAIAFSGAVSGTTFNWLNNNPSIGLAASGNGNIPAFTGVNGGTTAITATITVTPSATGCTGLPETFTITVNPTPDVVQPASQTLCNGATTNAITFTGAVSSTAFNWVNSNSSIGLAGSGTGNIPVFTAINITNAPVTATITVTPSALGCTGSPQTFIITVNPTPNVLQPANQILCNGATTNAIAFSGAVSGTAFNWTNNNPSIGLPASGNGDIAGFPAINITNAPVTATITVSPSALGCTGLTQTFTITVNPTPNVLQPANQILCNGATTNTIAFSGAVSSTSFSWTNSNPSIGLPANGNGDIAAFSAINITNAPVTATITVTPSAASCGGLPQTFTITVNPTPNVLQPANQILCNGATTNAIAFSGSVISTTFSWTNSNPSIGLPASGNGDIAAFIAINITNAPVTATITVTPSATGCNGIPQTFIITVNPIPDVAQPANQTLCNGATTNAITFTGAVSSTAFNWTNSNPSIGLVGSGTGNIPAFTAINITNAPVTATITVTPSAMGCTGLPQTFTITINPTPDVVQPANQTLCNGATTNVIAFTSAVGGTTFSWSNNDPSIGLAASGNGDIPAFTAINITNAPVTATITVTPSATGCTGLPKTFTITVNPIPDVIQPSNQILCNGATTSSITFTGAVAGTTYSWINNNPAIGLAANGNGNIPSFTVVNPGNIAITAIISVTPSASGCTGLPQTFTITVNPTPDVVQPANQTLCNGAATAAIAFTGAVSGSTFNWTNSNPSIGLPASGNGYIAAFTAINITNAPVTATITVTPSALGCAGLPQTFTITVNPIPDVAQPVSQTLCNGATTNAVTFTGAVTGTAYSWTNNNPAIGLAANGNGNIPSFTAVNPGITPVTATITVTPSANGCTGLPQTFSITVTPTADVVQPANQTLCNGASTNAIAFTGSVANTTFSWTNSNPSIGLPASGNGDIAAFTAINITNAPVTATITVTPFATGCTGLPQTFTITVNPIPGVVQPANQTLCNGATTNTITFTGSVSGTAYNWTNSNTSIGLAASGLGNIPAFTAVNAGTTPVTATITVTPSASGCTGTPQIFTITINPTPTVGQPGNQTLCSGAAITAIAFTGAVSGTTYSWINSNPSIGLAASGTGNIASFTAINTSPVPVTASITVTPSASGCAGLLQIFTITVNPTPNVLQPANQNLCNGAITNSISFTGALSGTAFNWVNNNTSIGLAASGNGNIPAFTANNTGNTPVTATITVTPSTSLCTGQAVIFTITVHPTPVVNAGIDKKFCLGQPVQLSAYGASTYTWSPATYLSCNICPNPVATPVDTMRYIVNGSTAAGCQASDTIFLNVIRPFQMLVSPNDSLCVGESSNLVANGANTYLWSPPQGLSRTNIANPVARPVVTTQYRVVGYDAHNCFTDTGFIKIVVGPIPVLNLGPDLNLSTGTVVTLNPVTQNGPIVSWVWTPAAGLSCTNCPNPVATVRDNTSYRLTITNNYGCITTDDINISVFCKSAQVFIPNAFTPDGDGLNDILMVRGKGIVIKTFRIFNRWGELVFEKTNFNPNDTKYGWDGKVRGIAATPDVFVYTCEVICDNSVTYTYKGNITLLK